MAKRKRRRFTPEFKAEVVLEALRAESSQAELCRRHNLSEDQLSKWKQQAVEHLVTAWTSTDKQATEVHRADRTPRKEEEVYLNDYEDIHEVKVRIGHFITQVSNQKRPHSAFMNSERKEEFWYKEAYLLTDPDEDNLLDLIKKDIIIVDVRMHLRPNRVVRNHGTGFRIDEQFLNLCFGNREKVI